MLRRFLIGISITFIITFIVWAGFALAGFADPRGWAAWRVGLLPASIALIVGGIGTILFMTDGDD